MRERLETEINCLLVQWQPGNCTNYDLMFFDLGEGRSLIAWMKGGGSGGTAFKFYNSSVIESSYLAEKMAVNAGDAAGILTFLLSKGFRVMMPFNWEVQFSKEAAEKWSRMLGGAE